MKTIYSFLENSVKNFPDKLALVYKDRSYTYEQLQEIVDNIRSYLIKRCENQEIVSLYMENSDNWIATYFGILGSGCICNPIDLKTSDQNIISLLKFSKPRFMIISGKFLDKCKRLCLEKITKIITFEELLKDGDPKEERDLNNAIYSTIMFTSGTTGNQKAIRLPHQVVYNATCNIIEYLKLRYEEVHYAILPFSHSFGIGNVHATFEVGGTVIVADNTINLNKVLKEIVDYKSTFFAATPFTLKLIVDNFLTDLIRAGESLRVICTNTGPVEEEVTQSIIKNLKKTQFFTYYGLTEASRSTFHYFNLNPNRLGSVGRPSPNVRIKIVGSKGKEVEHGELGEVCISGNNTILEYWKNQEMTEKTFKEGWLFTGDIGYFDKRGFLYILGRKDDIVSIAGERVSLHEIDKVLQELDVVKEAASIRERDERGEFFIKSFIVLDKENLKKSSLGLKQIEKNILGHCRDRIEIFKTPRFLEFVESLPKTDSGKLKRRLLQ